MTSHLLGVLVRQRLRRDRTQLLVWLLGTGLIAYGSVASVVTTYGTPEVRAGILQVAVANPTILVLRGLPDGTSTGGFAFFELFAFLAVLAGLMSTFLVVRHTRAEEETGRAELVAATPAARTLPTVATVILGVLANLALGLIVALAFLSIGTGNATAALPGNDGGAASGAGSNGSGTAGLAALVSGSLLTGAALTGVGIFFVGVALVAAQVMRTSRAANGLSAALVGAAYLVAGLGNALGALDAAAAPDGTGGSGSAGSAAGTGGVGIDAGPGLGVTSAWPSWLSPIGWGHQTHPFSAPTALPLLLDLGGAIALIAVAFAVQASRDSGASLLGARAGRASASPSLRSPFALAWRLQWPSIVGWGLGGAVLGALVGTLGPAVQSAIGTDPSITATLQKIAPGAAGGPIDIVGLFVTAIFSIVGVLAAGSGIQSVIRLRHEQTGGTAELVLASAVSRPRWMLGYLFVGTITVVVVLGFAAAVAALLLGFGTTAQGDVLTAALAQLPAALVYTAGLALVFSVVPRATVVVGWGALAVGTAIGLYGALLGVPDGVRELSPFAHSPAAGSDWSDGYVMLALAVVAACAATLIIRRREVI